MDGEGWSIPSCAPVLEWPCIRGGSTNFFSPWHKSLYSLHVAIKSSGLFDYKFLSRPDSFLSSVWIICLVTLRPQQGEGFLLVL